MALVSYDHHFEDELLIDKEFIGGQIKHNSNRLSYESKCGKSKVWKRFVHVLYDNKVTAFVKCIYCDTIITKTSSSGTSGLLKHKCKQMKALGIDLTLDEEVTHKDIRPLGDVTDQSLVAVESDELSDPNDGHNAYQLEYKKEPTLALNRMQTREKLMIIDMIMNGDQRVSVATEKGKSEVWNRFERILVDQLPSLYVKCKYCDSIHKHTHTVGTKGLLKHRCKTDTEDDMIDSKPIEKTMIIDDKTLIKQLTEETNSLKLIVQKCLEMIDNCFCDNKYSSDQRIEVNQLLNDYNKFVSKTQTYGAIVTSKDRNTVSETNTAFDNSVITTKSGPKIGYKVVNRSHLIRTNNRNRNRVLKSIKTKYIKGWRYVCEWPGCEMKFRLNSKLREHSDTIHLGLKTFICDWPGCEEQFEKKVHLTRHTIKFHTHDHPFKCDECSFGSNYKVHLISHQRSVHSSEKAFLCDWPGCDYGSNYEKVLKTHKYTHSGEKPYKCNWPSCEWTFRQPHHLKAHTLKHTGERPVSCQHIGCDRKFTSRQAMRFHMQKVHNTVV